MFKCVQIYFSFDIISFCLYWSIALFIVFLSLFLVSTHATHRNNTRNNVPDSIQIDDDEMLNEFKSNGLANGFYDTFQLFNSILDIILFI